MQLKQLKTTMRYLSVGLMLTASATAFAKPAKPGLIDRQLPDGTCVKVQLLGDENRHFTVSEQGNPLVTGEDGFLYYARVKGEALVSSGIRLGEAFSPADEISFVETALQSRTAQGKAPLPTRGPGLYNSKGFPNQGEPHALVILVQFQDKEFTTENPADYFTRQLNEEGFDGNGASGSVRDYYIYNSMEKFKPTFDVVGPVTVSEKAAYYGGNDSMGYDKNPEQMVKEACELADELVDFTQYDYDGDGFVDTVFVYYAGYGEADTGIDDCIWPHQYALYWKYYEYLVLDGININNYGCCSELDGSYHRADGIGTFIHEFSHVLGLPDLYSTNSSTRSFTPQEFEILDIGAYNDEGRTPPNYSSYSRYALDWLTPEPLEAGLCTLEYLGDSNKAYIFENPNNPDEYYLFENRQQTHNDTFIPGHGMLIWHVDFIQKIWEDNAVNNTSTHQYVDLIEADNKRSSASRTGDPFPGTKEVTEFTPETMPAWKFWDETEIDLGIYNIKETDGVITFECASMSNPPSSVGTLAEDMEGIYASGNGIVMPQGSRLYTLDGRTVGSQNLQKGVYIVVTPAGKTTKLLVK